MRFELIRFTGSHTTRSHSGREAAIRPRCYAAHWSHNVLIVYNCFLFLCKCTELHWVRVRRSSPILSHLLRICQPWQNLFEYQFCQCPSVCLRVRLGNNVAPSTLNDGSSLRSGSKGSAGASSNYHRVKTGRRPGHWTTILHYSLSRTHLWTI